MNDMQFLELIIQVTRIADALEKIYDSDEGGLTGIEDALWRLDQHLQGKEDNQ